MQHVSDVFGSFYDFYVGGLVNLQAPLGLKQWQQACFQDDSLTDFCTDKGGKTDPNITTTCFGNQV